MPAHTLGAASRRGRWSWTRAPWIGPAILVGAAFVARAPGYVHQLFDSDEAAIATMGMTVSARGSPLPRRHRPQAPAPGVGLCMVVPGHRHSRPSAGARHRCRLPRRVGGHPLLRCASRRGCDRGMVGCWAFDCRCDGDAPERRTGRQLRPPRIAPRLRGHRRRALVVAGARSWRESSSVSPP